MGDLECASNEEPLSHPASKPAARSLMLEFGFPNRPAVASAAEVGSATGSTASALTDRSSPESYAEKPLLDTSERIAELLRDSNRRYRVECFQVISLDGDRRLIAVDVAAAGTVDRVRVSPRDVFFVALRRHASTIAVAHNHPSGNPSPSQADISLTDRLIRAGRFLEIEVLDHVILGRRTDQRVRDYVSLREMGCFQC